MLLLYSQKINFCLQFESALCKADIFIMNINKIVNALLVFHDNIHVYLSTLLYICLFTYVNFSQFIYMKFLELFTTCLFFSLSIYTIRKRSITPHHIKYK